MKKYLFVCLLLVGTTAALFAAGKVEARSASKSPSSVAADRAAIEALWVNYSKDAMDGNLNAFLDLHTRDSYKMPQDAPMFQPWKIVNQLKASWAKRMETSTLEMKINPMEIEIQGDYAYSMGTYSQVFTPKGGGKQTVFEGKFLDVLQKGADGKWRILRDCYNSNNPPGT